MEISDQETFATRLRQVMEERSITQVELSRMANVTQGAVSRWLAGTMPAKARVKRMATYMNLNEDWLLTGVGSKELALRDRIKRDQSKDEQGRRAQHFMSYSASGLRVIYIQEHPDVPKKELLFDSATDEHWMQLVHLLEEQCEKAKKNARGTLTPL